MIKKFLEFINEGKLNEGIQNDLPKIIISFTSIIKSYRIIKILFKENAIKFLSENIDKNKVKDFERFENIFIKDCEEVRAFHQYKISDVSIDDVDTFNDHIKDGWKEFKFK